MTAPGDDILYRVVGTDNIMGWDDYRTGPLRLADAEAFAAVHRRAAHGLYSFEAVPVEPWMADNAAVRERHDQSHGRRRMEECGDRDCREATVRLLSEALGRRLAGRQSEVEVTGPARSGAESRRAAGAAARFRWRILPGEALAAVVRTLGVISLSGEAPGAH